MKFERKCPCCHKKATIRIGKLDFCDTHAKDVHRLKAKAVWTDRIVGSLGKLTVYQDYQIPIY